MEVKTYRAASMYEALRMVRRDLGPDAVVLQTRDVRSRRLLGLLAGSRQIEVTASAGVNVPSRLPASATSIAAASRAIRVAETTVEPLATTAPTVARDGRPRHAGSAAKTDARGQNEFGGLQGMVHDLCRQSSVGSRRDLPDTLFGLFTDLIEADVDEQMAGELIEQLRRETRDGEPADPALQRSRLAGMLESFITVTGPIQVMPNRHRLVALVGPTGVGKTTTIAKLAANHRLKLRQNVGLITVDTYRIAAVEQLRTYADIIDLPMQVVSTPREMREAVRRLSGMDLILMDTAGRSPRDEVKIQELKAFLTEAGADEVHLVLGSTAGSRSLEQTAQRFAAVGTTALILTKLDEAAGLGNLLPLLQSSALPLSYLTNGQNVPDDIETAQPARLANLMLSAKDAEDRL
ncbi:MAG TPA: flagellar biosynthesis protein FlhF [Planctomycetaceae bacterium]|nr:flagellar biosynthesis protein FlhF [Planctomycetaceae bacterium]